MDDEKRFIDSSNVPPKARALDRIEGENIILDAGGLFPKKVVIVESTGTQRVYELKKTHKGGYLFN